MDAEQPSTSPVWDKQPGEPARWYARFETYRLMGPYRSINAVYRATPALKHSRASKSKPDRDWYGAAQRWNWQGRAEAWDEHVREQVRAHEEQRRFDSREARLRMIDRLLNAVFDALMAAHLDAMPAAEVRATLPALRALFRDLVMAQRFELDMPTPTGTPAPAPITVEDLQRAYGELAEWNRQLEPRPEGTSRSAPTSILPPELAARLAAVLAGLYPNEASARRIAAQAGLETAHIAWGASALDDWHAIVGEAERADKLADLAAVVRSEYGSNRRLLEVLAGF